MTRLVLAVVATSAVAWIMLAAGPAEAVERPCPSGEFWDFNRGACAKKKKVKRQSPEDKYYAALEHLDGRAKNPDPAKGIQLLGAACKRKLGIACTQLGFVHLRGRGGVAADAKVALTWYDKGCTHGDLDGCIGAADIHGTGALGAIDHAKAVVYLERACNAGSGRACHGLAGKYQYALGVAADADKSAGLFSRAFGMLEAECDKGGGASCDLVGSMYRDGAGVAFDIGKAANAFDKGCTAGAGDACFHYGVLFYNGSGVTQDVARAYQLFVDSCKKYDQPDACFEAGRLLALSEATGDMTLLEPFAKRACQLTKARCDLLGYIMSWGIGVVQDQPGAIVHYEDACGAGNEIACRVLGYKYKDATGVTANLKTAVAYFVRACELNDGMSCTWAGKYYYWGDDASGLAKEPARAFEYVHLACLRDDHEACQWAGELLTDGSDGSGVPTPQRAIVYYQAGCDLGRGQSCSWAGELYQDGRATGTPDVYTAITLYERACWATIEPAIFSCRRIAGLRYAGAEVPKDLALAARAQIEVCRIEGDAQECLTADTYLKEAGAGAEDKQKLIDAMDAGCMASPPLENACVAHAWLLRTGGYAVIKNEKDSARRLGESCSRGNSYACVLWGNAYEHGLGVSKNTDEARIKYTMACDGGYQDGCYNLANLLKSTGEMQEAIGLLSRACDDGHSSACNVLGFYYYTAQGVRWDIAEANRLYEKGCELSDSVACSNVGEMWEYGITHDPDPKKAYELYAKACELGYQGGCGRAAWFLERGTGGATVDLAKAETFYTAGCDIDDPEACRRLGDLLKKKGGTAASRIAQLYQKAFDSAKAQSATNPFYGWVLGTYHRDGIATMKDPTKAAELFVKACEGYDPLGCLDAGRIYLGEGPNAVGLTPNPELAAVQLDKACAANVAEACKLAESARTGGTVIPLKPRAKSGCCDAGSRPGAGAGLLLILVAGALVRRRRS